MRNIMLVLCLSSCIIPREHFTDADGDGVAFPWDCNDEDPSIHPNEDGLPVVTDDPCDGVDRDCDSNITYPRGGTYDDADHDGYGDPAGFHDMCNPVDGTVDNADDCDDSDADIHPGLEDPEDGVDNDCDGEIDEDVTPMIDQDHDGYNADEDCDDTDPNINPAADEICDGLDNDCDGLADVEDPDVTDARLWYEDADHDGYGTDAAVLGCTEPSGYASQPGDCNDADAAFNPGASEGDCTDVNDYNCDGQTGYVDNDQDGFAACEECDDSFMEVHPGAEEVCDGLDNDCNGITDDPTEVTDALTFYADLDRDGFGNPTVFVIACEAPPGYVSDDTDCDDSRTAVNPGVPEICDAQGVDEDCDGQANDADSSVTGKFTFYVDADGDGYGGSSTVYACVAPSGTTAQAGDCDDTDAAFNPSALETSCTDPNDYNCDGSTGATDGDHDGFYACQDCNDGNPNIHTGATEVCNGLDDNCDGTIDGAAEVQNPLTFYRDQDGDGYGLSSVTTRACSVPSGYVATAGDCDDTKSGVNPSGIEICNGGIDDDCDSLADDADSPVGGRTTFYKDADTDTYGDAGNTKQACVQPSGYVTNATDCKDTAAAINPAAAEICDGKDNDCDGLTDEGVKNTYYRDADADGYGALTVNVTACSAPSGYVTVSTDCDDAAIAVHPNAAEACNGTDDNCDGQTDEGVKLTFYRDADGDGYGASGSTQTACSVPSGYVTQGTDCDDNVTAVHPGTAEACNGVDDNCTGGVDEGVKLTFYADTDGDGYGNTSVTTQSCSAPTGYVATAGDCDDTKPAVHPTATEVCNGLDDNCVNGVDEGLAATYYRDQDADGYGGTTTAVACSMPSGYTATAGDCDDRAAFVHPGVSESSKTASDDNCDGTFAHTDGVTTFTVSGGTQTVRFTGANLIGNTCDVTMGCGSLTGWHVYSYTLGNVTAATGPLAFTTTLGSTRNAAYFDNTGGAAGIEDECRSYSFTASVGSKYGITFDFANRSTTDQLVRVYRLTDYLAGRSTATPVYSSPYITAGTDQQMVSSLTAGSTTEGFVLCAGGVDASSAVGFTEAWIGPATVQ